MQPLSLGRKLILETEPEIDPFAKPIDPMAELTIPAEQDLESGQMLPISKEENETDLRDENLLDIEPDLTPIEDEFKNVILYYRWVE